MSASNGDRLIVFDTGALIELHTQEHFSALSRQVYNQASQIGMCYLVLPEIAGATGAMVRGKRLSKQQRNQIQSFVTGNLQYWLILPVSRRVCDLAFDLCQKHPLKGADAIHLAAVKILLPFRPQLTFFTLDKTLHRAAKKEKIPVVTIPEFEHGR
jgi:predicted nucleic acid-binding protein